MSNSIVNSVARQSRPFVPGEPATAVAQGHATPLASVEDVLRSNTDLLADIEAQARGVPRRTFLAAIKQMTPILCAIIDRPGDNAPMSERAEANRTLFSATFHAATELCQSNGPDVPAWLRSTVMNSLSFVVAAAWKAGEAVTPEMIGRMTAVGMQAAKDSMFLANSMTASRIDDESPAARLAASVAAVSMRLSSAANLMSIGQRASDDFARHLTQEMLTRVAVHAERIGGGIEVAQSLLGRSADIAIAHIEKIAQKNNRQQLDMLAMESSGGESYREQFAAALAGKVDAGLSEVMEAAEKIVKASFPSLSSEGFAP